MKGILNSQGTHGVFKSEKTGLIYAGEINFRKFHGHGVMLYADGDLFSGEWRDGERHGFGESVDAAGQITRAQWGNNWINGPRCVISKKQDASIPYQGLYQQ